jgi:chromosome partitioning protein
MAEFEPMQIVVVAQQKGGAGKTTLSRHLAVAAQGDGADPVALIDADPQGGLAKWWNRRSKSGRETPAFVRSSLAELPQALEKLRRAGFRLVVIDTPPQVTALIKTLIEVAHLVLVPVRPSPDDLDAVGATIALVEECRKPMVFVINAATKKTRIAASAAIKLSQYGTVAEPMIHSSISFPTSATAGLTVGEVDPTCPSALEIAELWSYVATRLSKEPLTSIRAD